MDDLNIQTLILQLSDRIKSNPSLCKSSEFNILRTAIQEAENHDSEEEEDLPPEAPLSYFEIMTMAKNLLEEGKYTEVIAKCTNALESNPDSAKAYRCRSMAYWNLEKSRDAYIDMSEAQKIDYDNEYDIIHNEMKIASEKHIMNSTNTSTPLPNLNTNVPNLNNIDIASMMSNPEVMKMAQNLMNDPASLNQMMNMFQGNR